MARYTGPSCRICRRESKKLFLKGERCSTDKCALTRREGPPGEVAKRRRAKESGYAIHLREKQKLKRMYGLLENQFKNYLKIAERKKGVTGEILLQLLERRLDNIVYRLGVAPSRKSARQLVSHGHVLVNGKKVNIPSYLVNVGDTITLKEKSKKLALVENALKEEREIPKWLSFDKKSLYGKVLAIPKREDIPVDIKEELIVELYSK
ncbi:MAG TPA: 30S ribosomal protein S4 [bacterium (Candidatus Stahlbacteria)]|nr:30S ribosomal protein S4 [Candidatus Stahlbacteria bacterium]